MKKGAVEVEDEKGGEEKTEVVKKQEDIAEEVTWERAWGEGGEE